MRTFSLLAVFTIGCVGDTPTTPTDASTDDASDSRISDTSAPDSSDAPSCGAPSQACCSGSCIGGAACTMGTCACPAQTSACGAACVDTQSDPANCGKCGHDCLGGACSAAACKPLSIAAGQGLITAVALDTTSVYWSRAYPATGAVFRADRDGKNVSSLQDYGANNYAYVVGASKGYLYFRRATANVAGYLRCKLPDCSGGPSVVADNLFSPYGGAIDEQNARLYFARGTPYNAAPNGTILSVPLDGSQAPVQAVTSTTEPSPVAVVLANSTLYWINSGTYSADNYQANASIRKAPLGQNQAATTITQLASWSDPAVLAVDSKSAFAVGLNIVGGGGYDLVAVSIAGGSASPLVPMLGQVGALYADSVGVFWGQLSGELMECAAMGCNGKGTKVVDAGKVSALAADDKVFVWGTVDGFVWLLAR